MCRAVYILSDIPASEDTNLNPSEDYNVGWGKAFKRGRLDERQWVWD